MRRGMMLVGLVLCLAGTTFAGEKSILWVGRGKLAARPAASQNTIGRLYIATNCATAACTSTLTAGERECLMQDTGKKWDVVMCGTTTTTTTTSSTTTTT